MRSLGSHEDMAIDSPSIMEFEQRALALTPSSSLSAGRIESTGPSTPSTRKDSDSGYETTNIARLKAKKRSKLCKSKTISFQIPENALRFLSPEVERLGLQAVFYERYWKDVKGENTCSISVLEASCWSRTLALVLDTLILLVNGTSSGNRDFLHEAKRTYPLALQSLRRDLMAVSESPQPFYFLTIIHVLQLCEMFECIAVDHNDWRKHMAGMKSLLKIVPSHEHRRSAEQAGWILSRMIRVPFGLWNGLMNFDGKAYSQSMSTQAVDEIGLESDSLHVYGRIPEILQRAEAIRIRGRKAKPDVVADILEELIGAENVLHQVFAEMYSQSETPAYRIASLERFEDSLIAERVPNAVFPHAYIFPDIFPALQHAYYWMCLLALRTMHLDIREAVGKNSYPFEYDFCGLGIDTQTRNAYECADNLCMSLAYMSLPSQGTIGLLCLVAPVQLAARWYSRQKDATKLSWCRQAGDALHDFGFMDLQID